MKKTLLLLCAIFWMILCSAAGAAAETVGLPGYFCPAAVAEIPNMPSMPTIPSYTLTVEDDQYIIATDWKPDGPAQVSIRGYANSLGTDLSNLFVLTNMVQFPDFAYSGGAWTPDGLEMPQKIIDALVPGSVVQVEFTSETNEIWLVLPDAAAGVTRVGDGNNGKAYVNNSKTIAQIPYEMIAEYCGEDASLWGARMQLESSGNYQVYRVRVGSRCIEYDTQRDVWIISGASAIGSFSILEFTASTPDALEKTTVYFNTKSGELLDSHKILYEAADTKSCEYSWDSNGNLYQWQQFGTFQTGMRPPYIGTKIISNFDADGKLTSYKYYVPDGAERTSVQYTANGILIDASNLNISSIYRHYYFPDGHDEWRIYDASTGKEYPRQPPAEYVNFDRVKYPPLVIVKPDIPAPTIALPARLTVIDDMAFQACGSLVKVVIPNGVTGIGAAAFSHCPALTSVSIPASVQKIGAGAFSDCPMLTLTVTPGSAAEAYAMKNGIPCVSK